MASASDATLSKYTKSQILDICPEMISELNSQDILGRTLLPVLKKAEVQCITVSSANCAELLNIIMNGFTELKGITVCSVPVKFIDTAEYVEKMKVFLCFEQEIRSFRLLSLRELALDGVRNSKKEVNKIVRHTPNVEVLSVRLTESGLNDSDIAEIIASLKNLKHLTLKHCRPVGFRYGNAAYYQSDSLEHLRLVKCKNMDDMSIRTVSQAFPNLRQIYLICCGISKECYSYLDAMKKLDHVSLEDSVKRKFR